MAFSYEVDQSDLAEISVDLNSLPRFWKAFWSVALDLHQKRKEYHTEFMMGTSLPITAYLLSNGDNSWCVPCAIAALIKEEETDSRDNDPEYYKPWETPLIYKIQPLLAKMPPEDTWYTELAHTIVKNGYISAAKAILQQRIRDFMPTKFSEQDISRWSVTEFDSILDHDPVSQSAEILPLQRPAVLERKKIDIESDWNFVVQKLPDAVQFETTIKSLLPYLIDLSQFGPYIPDQLLYTAILHFEHGKIDDTAVIYWLLSECGANPWIKFRTPYEDMAVNHLHALMLSTDYGKIVQAAGTNSYSNDILFQWPLKVISTHLQMQDFETLTALESRANSGPFVNGLLLIQAYHSCMTPECFWTFFSKATTFEKERAMIMPFCPDELAESIANYMRVYGMSPMNAHEQRVSLLESKLCKGANDSSKCVAMLIKSFDKKTQHLSSLLLEKIVSVQMDENGKSPLLTAIGLALSASKPEVIEALRNSIDRVHSQHAEAFIVALQDKEWQIINEMLHFTSPYSHYGHDVTSYLGIDLIQAIDKEDLPNLDISSLPEEHDWKYFIDLLKQHRLILPVTNKTLLTSALAFATLSSISNQGFDYERLVNAFEELLQLRGHEDDSLTAYLQSPSLADTTRQMIFQSVNMDNELATDFLLAQCHEVIDKELAAAFVALLNSRVKAQYSIDWRFVAQYKEAYAKIEKAREAMEMELMAQQEAEQKRRQEMEEAEKAKLAKQQLEEQRLAAKQRLEQQKRQYADQENPDIEAEQQSGTQESQDKLETMQTRTNIQRIEGQQHDQLSDDDRHESDDSDGSGGSGSDESDGDDNQPPGQPGNGQGGPTMGNQPGGRKPQRRKSKKPTGPKAGAPPNSPPVQPLPGGTTAAKSAGTSTPAAKSGAHAPHAAPIALALFACILAL